MLSPVAQAILCALTEHLLEAPYLEFGRPASVPTAERFNIVFPSSFGSDRRKPVTPECQEFCEAVYWPLLNALLFGTSGWEAVRPHLTSLKLNTLRISEDEFYYNQPIYHFHLDHKIGRLEPKNEMQQRTMRMIFSTVPAALTGIDAGDAAAAGARVAQDPDPRHDSTVYLKHQPACGFHHNDELHQYLQRRFPERGLACGRERPLYEVCAARNHMGNELSRSRGAACRCAAPAQGVGRCGAN